MLRVSLSCIPSACPSGLSYGQHALPCWAPRRVGSRRDEENSSHMTFIESGGEGDSVAQPPVDNPRAGQSEGDLLEDTLLADLAIGLCSLQ